MFNPRAARTNSNPSPNMGGSGLNNFHKDFCVLNLDSPL